MKNLTTVTALLLCSALSLSAGAADNQLTSQEQADGWQLLFDGKDRTQWRNFKQTGISELWQIEDGALKLAGKGGGDILTKATFDNFELKLDWKIAESGNSGVFVRVNETGNTIYAQAPEIQILDNERHPDNKLPSHRSGSLYDMIASPPASHKIAGQWNQLTIRLQQDQLTVWQNGVQTAAIKIGDSRWQQLLSTSKFATWPGFAATKKGHIGLQDHGDTVWFKNIKIKELK